MGRDTWEFESQESRFKKGKRLNPLWRAVGCVVIIALSVGGYLFAEWFLNQNAINRWIPIPAELVNPSFAPGLPAGILIKGIFALMFMFISYAILSVLYAVLFPIEPGEYDHPPLKPGQR